MSEQAKKIIDIEKQGDGRYMVRMNELRIGMVMGSAGRYTAEARNGRHLGSGKTVLDASAHLIANELLTDFPRGDKVSDLYDTEPTLGTEIAKLIPEFEYPNIADLTIAQLADQAAKKVVAAHKRQESPGLAVGAK